MSTTCSSTTTSRQSFAAVFGLLLFFALIQHPAAAQNAYNPTKQFQVRPVQGGIITSRFDPWRQHPILGTSRPHYGIDIACPLGTPIVAPADGRIIVKKTSQSAGLNIAIEHPRNFRSVYYHLSRFAPGLHLHQRVSAGQVIGYVGSSGLATGNHLHLEVWYGGEALDPASLLDLED